MRIEPGESTGFRERGSFFVFTILAITGVALGWNKGQLPIRDLPVPATKLSIQDQGSLGQTSPLPTDQQLAADLALYCEMVYAVRHGVNYYDAGREKISAYGFPISSPLNWRLPTYAWLFSLSPNLCLVRLTLMALSIAALALTFVAHARTSGIGLAAITTFLLFGVVRWSIDGYAFLAQEPWAATLVLISLAAGALGQEHEKKKGRRKGGSWWRWLAIAAGTAALLFRELALPYCGVACLLAGWQRRWWEAAAWAIGILLFFGFFAWHVGQVREQLAGLDEAAGAGLAQWLRLGGLDFVLLTTRMNSLLFAAPGWLLWLFILASLLGLARRNDESSQVACLSALAYLMAFAVLGRPENFYWGLLPAPLLAWGTVSGVQSLRRTGSLACPAAVQQAALPDSGRVPSRA